MIKLRGNPALHLLDRYAGIPAVALLGALRQRMRSVPTKIQTIGLLKTGAIGDTVLLSGVVADLKDTFPHASLILFSSESNYEMACMLEGVDQVILTPLANLWRALRCIRSVELDIILDFGSWTRTEAFLTLFSKASFKIGFLTARQYRHYAYDMVIEHSSSSHEFENYRKLIRPLGVATRHLPIIKTDKVALPVSREYAVCHLWPGGRRKQFKEWPTERWLKLFEDIISWGMDVVLTGAESDRCRNEQVIRSLPAAISMSVINFAGTNLEKTAALLSKARMVVSVDTGIMHLASALGTPLVALHGPSSSARWGPLSKTAVVVETPLAGCGYINLGWERLPEPPPCMESISYDTVRNACLALRNGRTRNTLASTEFTELLVGLD